MISVGPAAAWIMLLLVSVSAGSPPDFLSAAELNKYQRKHMQPNATIGVSLVTYGRPLFVDFALYQIGLQTVKPAEVVGGIRANETHKRNAGLCR